MSCGYGELEKLQNPAFQINQDIAYANISVPMTRDGLVSLQDYEGVERRPANVFVTWRPKAPMLSLTVRFSERVVRGLWVAGRSVYMPEGDTVQLYSCDEFDELLVGDTTHPDPDELWRVYPDVRACAITGLALVAADLISKRDAQLSVLIERESLQ